MNIVCIAGNLTKNPELRSTQADKKVTAFTVAINEGKNKTEFVNCVAWEKTAEIVAQYCEKGNRVSLTGRLQTRKYTDKDGVEKYTTEVVVNQLDLPPKVQNEENGTAKKDAPKTRQEQKDAFDENSDIPF